MWSRCRPRRLLISTGNLELEAESPGIASFASLGDFTADRRLLFISALAICTGVIGVVLAYLLLKLINVATNLFFYQRISAADASPADNTLGLFVIPIAIAGALIVGLMARFGSERIRGHGIPEAIEVILLQGSRVGPRIAALKPVSAAISIGSGGPFGAEGPIIMTGGACGSLFAQLIHLSDAERKTLMVAGAVAGMSAVFATPMAAILLAVELLLFEWKPRSLVPVAVSSLTAYTLRHYIIGAGPVFPLETEIAFAGPAVFLCAVLLGISAGAVSALMTFLVYQAEDTFERLPLHWMWWPAIGGLAIGIGGYFFPRALGVGYETIGDTLQGELPLRIVFGVLIVKTLMWSISLGSGTSGGVLAPLLMIGAALGAVEARIFPEDVTFWAALGMAAVMGGTMRSPLTAVIFAVELTHDLNLLVPLLIAVGSAHAFTVLTLKRSILTEKLSRRGYHLSREYSVDPLELRLVKDVMRRDIVCLRADASTTELSAVLEQQPDGSYPVTTESGRWLAMADSLHLKAAVAGNASWASVVDTLVAESRPAFAYGHEPLRLIAHRMARTEQTRLPVLDASTAAPVGVITLNHLLQARALSHDAETNRARHMWVSMPSFGRPYAAEADAEAKAAEARAEAGLTLAPLLLGAFDRLRRRILPAIATSAVVLASLVFLPGWRGQAVAVVVAMAGAFAVYYEPPSS